MDQQPLSRPGTDGQITRDLPGMGQSPSFYCYTMECSGGMEFWQLLSRLTAASGRPLVTLHDTSSSSLPGDADGVGRTAPHEGQPRCGYGLLFDVEPQLIELTAGATRLLFLRDPRRMAVSYYQQRVTHGDGDVKKNAPGSRDETRPATFGAFLESPMFERLVERYRRFADLWRHAQNVVFLRYEHAQAGWHSIASELVAALKLPIDPQLAAAMAANPPPVGDKLDFGENLTAVKKSGLEKQFAAELATLEVVFADVIAALGYSPNPAKVVAKGPVADGRGNTAPGVKRSLPVEGIGEADPVLFLRLRANGKTEKLVLGRRIILDVDAVGCRPVIGQPTVGEKTVAVYGCSFTYGVTVNAEETFCSLLQAMYPTWRFENHGVSGYGTTHNLLRLQRNTLWNKPEIVTFCWISNHLIRNVASLPWVQTRTGNMARPKRSDEPVCLTPRAALDSSGGLAIQSIRLPRYDLLGLDLDEYAPNAYYQDLVCFRLFERAQQIVTHNGGHFFITTLAGHMSPVLMARVRESGIPVVDASLSGPKYNCLPDDGHPNMLANRIYAERIRDYLQQLTAASK